MADQRIGCRVETCLYNREGCECGLDSIEVKPCRECRTGKAEDETLCGSYKCNCK